MAACALERVCVWVRESQNMFVREKESIKVSEREREKARKRDRNRYVERILIRPVSVSFDEGTLSKKLHFWLTSCHQRGP